MSLGPGDTFAHKEEPSIINGGDLYGLAANISRESVKEESEDGTAFMVISGEGLLYYDPDQKDAFGSRLELRKDIEMSGPPGSGLVPFLCKTTGHALFCAPDDRCKGAPFLLQVHVTFDVALLEGYEGPLFAQVVGPWPACESVQVAQVMTEEKRLLQVAEEKHLQFLDKLKILFGAIDLNKDGYVTRQAVETFMEGPEEVTKNRNTLADPKTSYGCISQIFMGAGIYSLAMPSAQDVKKLDALLALEGDAKLSLDDLSIMS